MAIILFVYGLSFFTLGVIILSVRPKDSALFFANKIWLLGIFGIAHAFVEWIVLYRFLFPQSSAILLPAELLLLLLSYLFLFEFSRFIIRQSFKNTKPPLSWLHALYAGPVIYILSSCIFITLVLLRPTYQEAIIATRYTFGFWGSFLLGIGLMYYGNTLKSTHIKALEHYFRLAGVGFVCYAFFGGIVVPFGPNYLPAAFINTTTFYMYTGLPVEVFRTICAIIIAIASIKALEIFRYEIAQKLLASNRQVKEFSANASHQLKTPLAAIGLQIDVTLQKNRTHEEYQESLHAIKSEVHALQGVVTRLLLMARTENTSLKRQFKPVPLDDVVLHVVSEHMIVAKTAGIKLSFGVFESWVLKGDKTLLEVLVANLVDNAIKFTPRGKTVTISLKQGHLQIQDQGKGIDTLSLSHVFTKNYHTVPIHDCSQGSYGLGLTLAQKIAQMHALNLTLVSLPGQGTCASLSI